MFYARRDDINAYFVAFLRRRSKDNVNFVVGESSCTWVTLFFQAQLAQAGAYSSHLLSIVSCGNFQVNLRKFRAGSRIRAMKVI